MKKSFLNSGQHKVGYILFILIVFCLGKTSGQALVKKANFNTEYDETTPSFYKSGIIYSSSRKNKLIKTYMTNEDHHTYDLFFQKSDSNYSELKKIFQVLNSPLDDASATFNKTYDTVYFSRTYYTDPTKKNSQIKSGIFFSYRIEDSLWASPIAMPFNNRTNNYGQPSLSTQGNALYFVSDEDGVGNTDIWVSYKNKGVWEAPMNLGKPINSPYGEISPFIYNDTVLYFSSNRKKDKDFDVYKYSLVSKKFLDLEIPEINTEKNQFGFIRNDKNGDFYWVSDFSGNKDIMHIALDSLFTECTYPTTTNFCRHFMVERDLDTTIVLHWDFGDSTKEQGREIDHCYDKPGVYNVVLDVVDVSTGIRYKKVAGYKIEIKEEPVVNINADIEPIHPVLVTQLSSSYKGNSELWIWKSKFTGTISHEKNFDYYPSYNVVDSLSLLVYDLDKKLPMCSGRVIVVSEQYFGEKTKIALNKNSILNDLKQLFPSFDVACAKEVKKTEDLLEYAGALLSCTVIEYEISIADEQNGFLLLELNKKN